MPETVFEAAVASTPASGSPSRRLPSENSIRVFQKGGMTGLLLTFGVMLLGDLAAADPPHQAWQVRFRGTNSNGYRDAEDEARFLGLDSNDNIFVLGETRRSAGYATNAIQQYAGNDGSSLWARSLNGVSELIRVSDFKVSPDGSAVAVCGSEKTFDGKDRGWILNLEVGSSNAWNRDIRIESGLSNTWADAITFDGEGNIVAAGSLDKGWWGTNLFLRRFSPTGHELWHRDFEYTPTNWDTEKKLLPDSNQDVFAVIELGAGTRIEHAPADPSYSGIARHVQGPSGEAVRFVDAVMDSTGHLVILGIVTHQAEQGFAVDEDFLIMRRNSATGRVIWTQTFDRESNDNPVAVVTDHMGNVIVTGYFRDGIPEKTRMVTLKYAAADGTLLWSHIHSGRNGASTGPIDLSMDPDGHPVVVGHSQEIITRPDGSTTTGSNDDLTLKLDGSDGSVRWEIYEDLGSVVAAESDSQGGVIVLSTKYFWGSNDDWLTTKYTDTDNLLPVADAGLDQHIEDPEGDGVEPVSLDGSSSSDPDGEIVSYLWEWQNGGAQSATGVSPAINLPVGTTTVTLTVTDDAGGTASDTVDITVTIPSYQVTFNLDGKGSRSGGGSLSQWIEASQDATAPSVSALDGWFFTGWDRDFTDITADITVMALYTTDFNNVAPDQDATVRTSRTAPPADAPPSSLEMGSLTVENGGSFELGASETLTLNSGPMTVSNGATIGGGGSIVGDLTLEPGSQFEFSPDSTLSVSGAVTMDPSFGVDDLGGLDASVPGGTYTLIDDTGTVFGLMGLENWGEENAYDLGGGKRAYFAEGSLMLVVTDASTSFSTWSGGASGDSDTNGDGIAALAAYALGAASPDENALQRLPTLETTGNEASYGLGFTDREDVTYTILISADLSTWYRVAHKPAGGPWELDTTDDATPVYQNVGSLGVIPSGDGIELNHADPPDGIFFSTEFEQPSTP